MSSANPSPLNATAGQPPRRFRDIAILAAILVAMLLGLLGLAAATGWEDTMAQISKLGWQQVGVLLALSIVNYVLRGLRWHIFARRVGLWTPLARDLIHFFGGFAMIVTPGRVGELVRMRWIKRETGLSFEKTAPLVLIDRASDLSSMALLLAVTVALSKNEIIGAMPVSALALLAALVATRPQLMAGVANLGFRLIGRWPRLFARIRTAARALGQFTSPSLVGMATLLGMAGWFAESFAFFLILDWMGADMSLPTAGAVFIFATVVGGLTGAPGGVGGTDATLVALLTLQGVPLSISLPATAVIRLTTLWFAIAIGLIVFPFAERHSIKVRDALEKD